jgi:NAD(P)-dependent dehydrogenase (short-subunit alcohol dehydrogenase family)
VLGIDIEMVTIIPGDGFLGRCSIRWEPYERGYILAQMAGCAAELELLGSTANDMADRRAIDQAVRCQELHEATIRRQARRLVRKHRAAIERVARALLSQAGPSRSRCPGTWPNPASADPSETLGRPEEVATAVAFLACDDASYITGIQQIPASLAWRCSR